MPWSPLSSRRAAGPVHIRRDPRTGPVRRAGYRHPVPSGPDPASLPALSCTTPDGVELAVYDFGGDGDDLLLVHATGFCAGVLLPLARALADRFRCHALDLRGHGRSGRPADGDFAWSGFATDVLTVVDRLGLDEPVGFGHSCGGASLLLAEQARPGTFRSLYLFEPVVVPDQDRPLRARGESARPRGARRRRGRSPRPRTPTSTSPPSRRSPSLDPDVLRRYVEDGFEVVPAPRGGRPRGPAAVPPGRRGRGLRARVRNGAFAQLPRSRARPMFAYGERPTPSGRVMGADAARMPDAGSRRSPDLGHFGPLRAPRRGGRRRAPGRSGAHDGTPPS